MENWEIVDAFWAVLPVNIDSEEKISGVARDFSVSIKLKLSGSQFHTSKTGRSA
mgnify:CR=1 FL=1